MAVDTLPIHEAAKGKAGIETKAPTLDTSIETLDLKKSTALAPHVINLALRELADHLRRK